MLIYFHSAAAVLSQGLLISHSLLGVVTHSHCSPYGNYVVEELNTNTCNNSV